MSSAWFSAKLANPENSSVSEIPSASDSFVARFFPGTVVYYMRTRSKPLSAWRFEISYTRCKFETAIDDTLSSFLSGVDTCTVAIYCW